MADDLQNYKLQLQQVEAALLTDENNTELLKLKEDLEEVIGLTRDLIKQQFGEQKKSSYVETSTSRANHQTATSSIASASSSHHNDTADDDDSANYDEVEAALLAAERLVKGNRTWKIGDKCQAKWTEDGNYYDATIEGIADGDVNVVFDAYQNRSTTTLTELRECVVRNDVFPSNKRNRPNNKEYLKKKKLRKQQRFKEIDEERESEKNKWINFTSKTGKKAAPPKNKSIFASPDNVNGRVGIGTCGVSGKEMTKYSYGEKYRKGT